MNRPPGATALGNSFNEHCEEEAVYGGSRQGGPAAEDPPTWSPGRGLKEPKHHVRVLSGAEPSTPNFLPLPPTHT